MKKVLLTHTSLNSFIIQPESYGATVDEGFIVGGQLVILNFALPRNGLRCREDADRILPTQQKFDLFNKAPLTLFTPSLGNGANLLI